MIIQTDALGLARRDIIKPERTFVVCHRVWNRQHDCKFRLVARLTGIKHPTFGVFKVELAYSFRVTVA